MSDTVSAVITVRTATDASRIFRAIADDLGVTNARLQLHALSLPALNDRWAAWHTGGALIWAREYAWVIAHHLRRRKLGDGQGYWYSPEPWIPNFRGRMRPGMSIYKTQAMLLQRARRERPAPRPVIVEWSPHIIACRLTASELDAPDLPPQRVAVGFDALAELCAEIAMLLARLDEYVVLPSDQWALSQGIIGLVRACDAFSVIAAHLRGERLDELSCFQRPARPELFARSDAARRAGEPDVARRRYRRRHWHQPDDE